MNVEDIKRLILGLIELEIKPVFTSTDQVFDGTKGDYSESDSTNPLSTYGQQKVEIELFLSTLEKEYLLLRLSKIYGIDPDDGTFFSGWLNAIRQGLPIRCAVDERFS